MASATDASGEDRAVELPACDTSATSEEVASVASSEDIAPFLIQSDKKPRPKINIFTLSFSRRKTREHVTKFDETDKCPFTQFFSWVWGGSKYSGLLCMALSSIIYFVMEVVSDTFSVESIPLLETAFSRYTVFLIFSYWWLRRNGHPIFGPSHAWNVLGLRAIMGFLSLMSFVYCIQMAPLSQAIVLSFTSPIIGSIMARIILQEKLQIQDIGGLACSFIGVLFIFRQALTTQGRNNSRATHIYAVLLGLFSSITGGVSYCLIKIGAKAADQPMVTVFAFVILASPAAGICAFALEDLVLPSLYSFGIMLILAVLAFFAEVFFARGLQLELIGKVGNVLYMEAALSQVWGMASSIIEVSIARLVGCFLILFSVSYTFYIEPDLEIE